MKKQTTYTEEFKKTIIKLYELGRGSTELGREYGINPRLIYYWKKRYGTVQLLNGDSSINMQDLLKIQKENNMLKEENEILKKAMAIFTQK